MAEYIHLIGAEEVSRAGHNMSSAASEMNRAASSIDDSLRQHQRFLDDWLARLESVMKQGRDDILSVKMSAVPEFFQDHQRYIDAWQTIHKLMKGEM